MAVSNWLLLWTLEILLHLSNHGILGMPNLKIADWKLQDLPPDKCSMVYMLHSTHGYLDIAPMDGIYIHGNRYFFMVVFYPSHIYV